MVLSQAASRRLVNLVSGIVLFVLMVWTVAPLYWMVATSLKSNTEIYGAAATLWPKALTFDNYTTLFAETNFPIYFRNSVIVALATVVLSLVISALGAYALTRLRFRGRRVLAQGLVYTYLMPSSLLFIPLLIIVRNVGLQNTMEGLVLSYLGFTVPFCTWLLMGYFISIPVELEESAMIDGCSRLGVLWRIVLPLTLPALAIVAFFSFTLSWNEFIYASVLVTDANVRTIPTGIPDFVVADVFFWGPMMASTLISTLPPLIVYFVFQRFLISGLTLGAVKG
ncbi:MAG: carbohydrate ABC transporter permease [Devosia sp.]|jgi:multiple sugar transport system permease protein|uniref:carbohydrate ABC transporter permease n=1 Tax=Devosia sp. TaxID=1871048 RepID=UPI001A56A77F|nr:carbohydrate ABC transporter permease [Devosia sp.]MBL8599974.1 carbohydrate ABC transporter permease [Devosia sp.]